MLLPNGRRVMVDDSSSLIQYHGDWFTVNNTSMDSQGNYGGIYNTTQHGTLANSSLTFHYNGTYFLVMGTIATSNDTGTPDPQWECYVDNVKADSGSFQFYENNWWLCEPKSIDVDDGPHVLTVNTTVKNHPFWIDRIDYVPSPTVNMEDKVIFVEQTDPELQFGPGWGAQGVTANITREAGSKFNFFFYGVSVSWFGYLIESPAEGTGLWSIDDEQPTTFPVKAISSSGPAQYNQELFRTPDYPRGFHKLTVTYLGPTNTAPLILDYLIVRNVTESGTTGISTAHNLKKGSSKGVIVGGSLVALALVLFAVLVFLYLQKRRKSHNNPRQRLPRQARSNPTTSPFVSRYPQAQPYSLSYDLPRSSRRKDRQLGLYTTLPKDGDRQETSLPRLSRSSQPDAVISSPPRPINSTHSRVIVHEDSGIRNIPVDTAEAEPLLEIPPLYTPG